MMINTFVSHPKVPYFKDGAVVGHFDTSANWQELSGITAPNLGANFNWLWICSDSPANMIGGVRTDAPSTKFVLTLTGATAMVDLEDITSARINGVNYLYGMDMGNNPNTTNSRGSGIDLRVFRIVEPTITGSDISTSSFIEINCAFPGVNGPTLRDAEASFVDPVDGKLYIIIKRDATQKVYSLPHATSYAGTQTLTYEGTMTSLPESRTIALTTTPCYAVSACISPDGKEILVKNYSKIYHFSRRIGTDTVIAALQKALFEVSYVGGGTLPTPATSHPNAEPQGEGVCFDVDGINYYTNSEYVASEGSAAGQYPLFRYDRVSNSPTTIIFQDGVHPTAGYAGTLDTYIQGTTADTNHGTEATIITDKTTGNALDDRRALLKFDLTAIPTTARIISAKLELWIANEGQGWTWHRMLISWNESSTYNSLSSGVSIDGSDAVAAESARNGFNLNGVVSTTVRDNILVADVQEMVSNPSTNYGWIGVGTDVEDGVQFDSRQGATASRHPKLTVKYV